MSGEDYIKLGNELQKASAFAITRAARSSATGTFNISVSALRMLLPFEIESVKRLICDKLMTSLQAAAKEKLKAAKTEAEKK